MRRGAGVDDVVREVGFALAFVEHLEAQSVTTRSHSPEHGVLAQGGIEVALQLLDLGEAVGPQPPAPADAAVEIVADEEQVEIEVVGVERVAEVRLVRIADRAAGRAALKPDARDRVVREADSQLEHHVPHLAAQVGEDLLALLLRERLGRVLRGVRGGALVTLGGVRVGELVRARRRDQRGVAALWWVAPAGHAGPPEDAVADDVGDREPRAEHPEVRGRRLIVGQPGAEVDAQVESAGPRRVCELPAAAELREREQARLHGGVGPQPERGAELQLGVGGQ
jgi:hypothetical protein